MNTNKSQIYSLLVSFSSELNEKWRNEKKKKQMFSSPHIFPPNDPRPNLSIGPSYMKNS